MKSIILLCLLFGINTLQGQPPIPILEEELKIPTGYDYIPFEFEGEQVNITIVTGGEDYKTWKKPLFLYVQGSLPRPLFMYRGEQAVQGCLAFNAQDYLADYHFIVIGKPGVPFSAQIEELEQPQFTYKDPTTGAFPRTYCKNNHLDYYVKRNKAILKYLSKQDWVDNSKIVVAGHSEGVQVAFKMAIDKAKMTHLVLLNAGLEGRIMSIITQERSNEKTIEDYQQTEERFRYWESLVHTKGPYSDDCSIRDSDKVTASFSFPYRKYLKKIKLPVFFGYGTKDESVLLMDTLRVQTIRMKKENFHYKLYFELEHSFMKVKEDGVVDYDDYRFDQVATDFFSWLETK